MYDMTEGTFTNFVGYSELRGEVDRSEKEPPQRASLAGWETGLARLPPRFNQDACAVSHKGWKCRLGSDWMKCSSASPGQQRALAAVKANVSQEQHSQQVIWGCPAQQEQVYVRSNLEHSSGLPSSGETWKMGMSPMEGWRN